MKKRWLQNTLAIVLTAAMCLGLAPCGGPGRIFQAAETKPAAESWTDTNLFTNGDLTEATDEWKVEITDPSGDGTKFTINEKMLNANNGSGKINSMSAERTVENVPAGTYRLVFEQNGGETDASVFTLFVKNGETVLTQKELEPTVGWNDGKFSAVETEAFTLEKQSNLTITLSASACPDKYWVNFDNFKLQKSVPSTEIGGEKEQEKSEYTVSIEPSTKSVVFGSSVTFTATVEENGEKLTAAQLKEKKLNFYWWPDKWSEGHENGQTAAEVSYPKGEDELLTAEISLQSVGTYYITGQLQSEDESIDVTGYSEVTVTEPEVDKDTDSGIYVQANPLVDDEFITGVDISSYLTVKASGAKYYDGEKELNDAEFFQLLKDGGTNYVRLRVWNDPYDSNHKGYGGGNCDLETAIKIGKLATDAGMGVLIDFHYSDFWADPSRQLVPKAWKDLDIDAKAEALKKYTSDSLKKLKEAGVSVAMVQVGNETTSSICGETNWENQAKLYRAGCEAVREADPNILIAIHVETPNKDTYDGIAANLEKSKIDYDVFASSYYPYWHCSTAELKETLQNIVTKYHKKVMIAEIAWPFTLKDGDGTANNIGEGTERLYDFSPQGQADAVADAAKTLTEITPDEDGNGAIGLFWWEPAWLPPQYAYKPDGTLDEEIYESNRKIQEEKGSGWAASYADSYDQEHVQGGGGTSWDNQAWFDFNGKALPSVNIYKYLRSGALTNRKIVGTAVGNDVTVELGTTADEIFDKYLPNVTILYNYGGNVTASGNQIVWSKEELQAAVAKGAGEYTISGKVDYTDAAGRNIKETVSFKLTIKRANLLTEEDNNYSFENEEANWTLTGDRAEDGNDGGASFNNSKDNPYNGEHSLHYYCSSDVGNISFTVSQKVVLDAGTYLLGAYYQGDAAGKDDTYAIYVKVGNRIYMQKTMPTGYADSKTSPNWKEPNINFEIAQNQTEAEIGILVDVKNSEGAWGDWDDLYLNLLEKKTPEQAPQKAPAEVGLSTEDLSSVSNAVLSSNEYQESYGDFVYAELKVNEAKDAASEQKIRQTAAAAGYELGMCMDLSLFAKFAASNNEIQIKRLGNAIEVSITVPEALRGGSNREFGIVRLHDNGDGTYETELIEKGVKLKDGKITFLTDRFSVYAIVYKDVQTSGGSNPQGSTGSSSNSGSNGSTGTQKTDGTDTGDHSPILPFAVLLFTAAGMTGLAALRRRKAK